MTQKREPKWKKSSNNWTWKVHLVNFKGNTKFKNRETSIILFILDIFQLVVVNYHIQFWKLPVIIGMGFGYKKTKEKYWILVESLIAISFLKIMITMKLCV